MSGTHDPEHISTSYVECLNITMRMKMRRFTRLTSSFSKKLENPKAATALHFAQYNFVRVCKTLRITPAMEAGVAKQLWSIGDPVSQPTSQADATSKEERPLGSPICFRMAFDAVYGCETYCRV